MSNRRILWLSLALACLTPPARAGQPLAAAPPWRDERVVGPLLCRAEFPLEEIHGLLAELQQLQDDLVRTLGIVRAKEPIELCLFRSKSSYQQFLARNLPAITYRRALYLKSGAQGRVLAYRSPEFETDIRHECTHGLLHAALPMVPLWLDEGLAEYFELPRSKRAFDNPHLSELRWSIRIGRTHSLSSLEIKESLEDTGRDDYRNAWAWVHFLFHGSGEAHAEMVRFLGDIRAGRPTAPLSQRLRQTVPGLEALFVEHFRNWARRSERTAWHDGRDWPIRKPWLSLTRE